jgi:hypothetical protein
MGRDAGGSRRGPRSSGSSASAGSSGSRGKGKAGSSSSASGSAMPVRRTGRRRAGKRGRSGEAQQGKDAGKGGKAAAAAAEEEDDGATGPVGYVHPRRRHKVVARLEREAAARAEAEAQAALDAQEEEGEADAVMDGGEGGRKPPSERHAARQRRKRNMLQSRSKRSDDLPQSAILGILDEVVSRAEGREEADRERLLSKEVWQAQRVELKERAKVGRDKRREELVARLKHDRRMQEREKLGKDAPGSSESSESSKKVRFAVS